MIYKCIEFIYKYIRIHKDVKKKNLKKRITVLFGYILKSITESTQRKVSTKSWTLEV